jgi:hypothetical protein
LLGRGLMEWFQLPWSVACAVGVKRDSPRRRKEREERPEKR